ncbi:ankyrin repeat domain-containing protein [Maribacter confluentis]|uniref:Ankyrin repeat domain-containing protein n=1 Tax=Maribacter confluentis TaxID=1656093 RepID=A0ABT8RL20_9FLAO|nr:ankyrin repeat domain-containing protein [Maribacter confluentis]MDO1511642.1 ankyrin repeat domain-containing protein [Maribacter confluentis]
MKSNIHEYLLNLNNKSMLKTLKINFLGTLVNMSLVLLLLTAACGQSNNKTKVGATNNTEAKSAVAKPEIDIQTAILSNNLEAVKQHISAGTDLNIKDPMTGATPLITAASFGKNKIAQLLIDAGADLTVKNNDGATALHTAAFFCRVEVVQSLIDAKADKTAKNNFGMTPRESVMGPFAEIKPIYEMLQQQLGPIGLQIDLMEIEKTRPVIAMMLQ